MAILKKKIKFQDYICFYLVGGLFLYALISQWITASRGIVSRSSANLFTQIAYSIILAVSLNLVVGFLGELSLGHAGFMCIGAYLGSFFALQLSDKIHNSTVLLLLSMLVGGLLAAVFGLLVGLPALRLKGDYLAIVTLAFGEIIGNLCKNMPWFGGAVGLSTTDIRYGTNLYIPAFIVAIAVVFISYNLIHSKHGRAVTAIRDNEIAARAMGINVTFYKLFIFVIAAFFAGVAGVIYGELITPVRYFAFSYNYSIEILVMVVLGGMASLNGSIIAAALIAFVNLKLQAFLSGEHAAYKYLIYALILIGLVIFNNAPKLAGVKEQISPKNLLKKIRKRKISPDEIHDDAAEWNKIPTKIPMDELLSVDLQASDPNVPDKPKKEGKGNG